MILDKIENSELYAGLSERLAKGFAYIKNTDLLNVESGKYLIDNEDVFALVQEYETKDLSEGKLEVHRKYIDIQYVITGVEQMGVATLKSQKAISDYDERDVVFFEGDSTLINVEAGMFTVFFPDDLHMPGIMLKQKSKVKKVVVKVRV